MENRTARFWARYIPISLACLIVAGLFYEVWKVWSPLAPQPVTKIITTTHFIVIMTYNSYEDKEVEIARLYVGADDHLINLLRQSRRIDHVIHSGAPDLVFGITRMPGMQFFNYYRSSGELGSGMEWCVVPLEFRKWLDAQLIKASPGSPPKRVTNSLTNLAQ